MTTLSTIRKSKSSDREYTVSAEKAIEWIYSDEIFVAVWNKIYNADLLKRFDLLFNESIWYGEGMLFNIECLQHVDSVAIGEMPVYHQTYNPDSAMRKFNLESNMCGIRSMELQKSIWTKKNERIEKEWQFHRYRFNRTIASGLIRSDMINEHPEVYKKCIQNIRKDIMLPLVMEKNFKARIGWICYFVSPQLMANRKIKIKAKPLGGGYNRLGFHTYNINIVAPRAVVGGAI